MLPTDAPPHPYVELEGWVKPRGVEGNVALEVLILVPVMMVLTLFVLWAGRGGRTELLADLAAEEAAVAASLCCLGDDPELAENVDGREAVVEDVLAARPGLDLLCIGGPRPAAGDNGDEGFVSEYWLEFPGAANAGGVGILGVHFDCETDGAVAPLRSTFPTVVFEGQAAEVVVLQSRPLVSIADVQAVEGHEILVTVSLDSTATEEVTLVYSTKSESPLGEQDATPGGDYTVAIEEIVTIPVGRWEATVAIPTVDDVLYERDEIFEVEFYVEVPPGEEPPVTLDDGIAVATILNDDASPVISFESESVSKIEGQNLEFVVKLDSPSELPASVEVEFIDSQVVIWEQTATKGTDFTPPPLTSISIPAGRTEFRISVSTVDDALGEGDETFLVRLDQPVHARLPDAVQQVGELDAVGIILDDEPRLTIVDSCSDIRFNLARVCVVEGDEMEFVLRLNDPLESGRDEVTVEVNTVDVTAVAGEDYDSVAATTVTFEIGDQEHTVRVQTNLDSLDEGDYEVFWLELSNGSDNVYLEDRIGKGVIIDDDQPPVITLSAPSVPVLEGETQAFTLTLSSPSGLPVLVSYVTVDGTATAGNSCGEDGVDFVGVPAPARAVIPAGQTSITVELASCADDLDESEEGFTLVVTNPVGAEFRPVGVTQLQAMGTITDDDEANLSVAAAVGGEGSQLVPGTVDFEVTLSPPSDSTVTVHYETRDRTADEEADGEKAALAGVDYEATSGILAFAPGERTKTVPVAVVHDAFDEFHEVFDFVLFDAVNAPLAGGAAELSVLGTIEDNDALPILSLEPVAARVQEGGVLVFEAILNTPSGRKVWFDHAVGAYGANEATWRTDFVWSPGDIPLGIDPGETALDISISTVVDGVHEGDETLILLLVPRDQSFADMHTHATLTTGIGYDRQIGTITDDGQPPEVSLSYPVDNSGDPLPAFEGDDLEFTVSLTTPRSANTRVRFRTIGGGTADPGTDFTPVDSTVRIPAGRTSATMRVATTLDSLQETDVETVRAEILDIPAGVNVGADTAVGAILDSGANISVGFVPPPRGWYIVPEGETLQAVVALSRPVAVDVEVEVYTKEAVGVPAPADAGDDFVLIDEDDAATVVIPSGQMSATVQIETVEDGIDEDDERFALWIKPPSNGWPDWLLAGRQTVSVAIADDDPNPHWEAPDPMSVVEAEGATIEFTVSLAPPSQRGEFHLDYVVEDFSRSVLYGVDYEMLSPSATSGRLRFPVGVTQQTVSLSVKDDFVPEDDEHIQLQLWAVPGDGLLPSLPIDRELRWAHATIIDDDLAVSLDGGARTEEGEPLEVTVRLDRPAPETLTVEYYTLEMAGTGAASAEDFVAVPLATPGVVEILAGSSSATFEVQTTEDRVHEGDERFQVRLVTPQPDTSLTVVTEIQVATIADDEDLPTLSVTGPSSGVEEDEVAEFTLELSGPSDQRITVDYSTRDGSATAGHDYFGVSRQAVFEPFVVGQPYEASLTVEVDTKDDIVPEQEETFDLVLSNAGPASAVTLGTAQAEATIVDNDLSVGLFENRVSADEGDTLEFTVELNRPAPETLTVDYYTFLVTGDDAASAGDFDHVPQTPAGQVQIIAGSDRGTIRVSTVDDAVHEYDERFQVRLASPQSDPRLILTDSTAEGVIENNDTVPGLTVTGPGRVGEGAQAEFTLELDRQSSRAISVDYATADGTAASPADYIAQSGTAIFSPGQSEYVVSVSTQDDSVPEGDKTFMLVLGNAGPSGAVTLDTARAEATIVDGDLTVQTSPSSASEDSGTATFVVELSAATTVDVTVDYFTGDLVGGATPGEDFVEIPALQPQTVTISSGSTSAEVTVVLIDDDKDEDDEMFRLMLSNPQLVNPIQGASVALANTVALGTIEDDDNPPEVSISGPVQAVAEGDAIEFAVSITGHSEQQIAVEYQVVGGTATAPDDFLAVPTGTITFAPGDTQDKSITVTTVDDVDGEDDETIEMGLTSVNSAGTLGTSTAVGTITDNDGCIEVGEATPPLTYDPALTVSEDAGTASITFTLIRVFCFDTRASMRTVAGTAQSGIDFTAVNGDIAIAAEASDFQVPVTITDDALDEADEAFLLAVTYDGATWGEVAVTITDDDGPEAAVSDATGREGDVLTFTVTLSDSSPQSVNVDYDTVDVAGGATGGMAGQPGADYEEKSGTLTFLPGETSHHVTVQTFIDTLVDPLEEFELQLDNAVNAGIDAARGTGTGSILESDCVLHTDDQEPLITFSVENQIDVYEDVAGSSGLVPVIFSSKPCSGSVFYTVKAAATGTATGTLDSVFLPGDDFHIIDTTGSLSSNQTDNTRWEYPASGIHNDTAPEHGDESFRVWIAWDESRMPTHYHDVEPVYTEVAIVDDDRASVSVGDVGALEGFDLEFEIELSEPLDFDITVGYSTAHHAAGAAPANGGDIVGEDLDYTPVSGSVTILAGETLASVLVNLLWDEDDEENETFLFQLSVDSRVSEGDGTAIGTIVNVDYCISGEDIEALGLGVVLNLYLGRSGGDLSVREDYGNGRFTYHIRARLCRGLVSQITVSSGSEGDIDVRTRWQSLGGLDEFYQSNPLTDVVYATGWVVLIRPAQTPGRLVETRDRVSVHDDNFYEGIENGTINIRIGRGIRQSFPLIIIDNDPMPQVSVNDLTIAEGDASGFTVSLSEASGIDTVVTYETLAHTSVGLPAAAGTDYAAASGSVTIPAYQQSVTVPIETLPDSAVEGDETFLIKLTGATNATLLDDEGIVTILDDESCVAPTNPVDQPLTLSIGSATVDENSGRVEVTVHHSRICALTDAIQFGTVATSSDTSPPSGETATPGKDYMASDLSTFDLRGVTEDRTFVLRIRDDEFYERGETFTVWAQWGPGMPSAYGSLSRVTATVTILDDDPEPVVRIVDAETVYGGELEFDILLESTGGGQVGIALPVTVHWETRELSSEDAAVSGTHFAEVTTGVTTIMAGQTQGTARVQTTTDDTTADRRMQVAITGVENATIGDGLADGSIITNTCIDPESGVIQMASLNSMTLHERNGSSRVHFDLLRHFCTRAAIYYSLIIDDSDGAVPADGEDVRLLSSRESAGQYVVSINSGSETSNQFSILVMDDQLSEPDETFILRYWWSSTMPDRYKDLEPVEVVVTIVDDD